MQCDDVVADTGVALLLYINVGNPRVLRMSLFQTVQFQACIVAYESLDDLCGEEVPVVGSMVAEEELGFRTFLEDNEHTSVDHQVDIRTEDVDHLHGAFHLYVLRHIDEKSVLCQHRVQCRYGIGFCVGNTAIVLPHQFRMFCCYAVQTVDYDAVIEFCLRQRLGIELVVDNEIKRSAEVGNIALESLVGIDRNLKTVEVQAIVRLKELLHIRVLVAFHFPVREAKPAEVLESLVAYLIENGCSVILDHLLRLVVEVYILFFALHCCFFLGVLVGWI